MTAPIESPSYATVADYELRTGIDVPDTQEPTVQQRLDDYSALMAVHMGPCAEIVETSYPGVLTSLACAGVQRSFVGAPGVRSESVGATSVSYHDPNAGAVAGVYGPETDVLDALMAACCPEYSAGGGNNVGQLGVAYNRDVSTTDELWVMSRW
jgi:hypothetical protein